MKDYRASVLEGIVKEKHSFYTQNMCRPCWSNKRGQSNIFRTKNII